MPKTINVPIFFALCFQEYLWIEVFFIAKSQFHDKFQVISLLEGIRMWQMQEGDDGNNIVLTMYLLHQI